MYETELEVAEEAAKAAGEVQIKGYRDVTDHDNKAPRDLVTDIDFRSEEIIKDTIEENFPNDAILAEDTGNIQGSERRWIIDPLDGTTNFVHGVAHFCVSTALEVDNELEAGLIYHTPTQDVYTAVRGEGAHLNDEPISVSDTESFENSLVATGFAREAVDDPALFDVLETVVHGSHGVRRIGSAATDLFMVADGSFDAFYERFLNPWDIAAGVLIVREAGGRVTDLNGGDSFMESGDIVATNGNDDIHGRILSSYS